MSSKSKSAQQNAINQVASYLEDYLNEPAAFRGQVLRGAGPIVEFETKLADTCQFPYCVATANATIALMGLGLLFQIRNKEILIPENHWPGTAAAFRLMGAKIKHYSESMDLEKIIFSHPKACLVITTEKTPPINLKSKTSNPIFIEDSQRSVLPTQTPKTISPWDIQVLSFGPGKPLSLGEGGAVLFRSENQRRDFIRLTQHPERFANEYEEAPNVPSVCLNGRIHPVAAILGSILLGTTQSSFITN